MSRFAHMSLSEKFEAIPKLMLLLLAAISIFGFFMMYSAAGGSFTPWASRQIFRFSLFFIVMIVIAITDIKVWLRYSYLFYIVGLVMLVGVDVFGSTVMVALSAF